MEASDLKIIQHLYFKNEKSIIIFDPSHQLKGSCPKTFNLITSAMELMSILDKNSAQEYIVFNLSKSKNDFDTNHVQIKNIVSFNQSQNTESAEKFFFINNPNGTMRWIYPSNDQSPTFLSLYNNAGWKAMVFKSIIKICFRLGIKKMFTHGYFTFKKRNISIFKFFPNEYYEDYAIFTGTQGENRKAIIAVSAHNYTRSFLKVPLTKKAKALVQNERHQLSYLQELDLIKMKTPKCDGSEDHLILSNIKPASTIAQSKLTDYHLEAIAEFYNKTSKLSHPENISAWSEIKSNLDFLNGKYEIQNNLDQQKINKITQRLNQLFNKVEDSGEMSVGLAHGDFTPWNMYLSKEQIRVYDWEMSSTDMPLLFDVFHFVFQNQILIKQGKYESIKRELNAVKQNEIIQNLISDYSLDWTQHYAFYLVYITSYYLALYVNQEDLHMQAHWLVDVWAEALESIQEGVLEPVLI